MSPARLTWPTCVQPADRSCLGTLGGPSIHSTILWKCTSFCVIASVSRDFLPLFFRFRTHLGSGLLINRIKYFQIRFWFRHHIQNFKKLRGVNDTTESDSSVSCSTQNQEDQITFKAPLCNGFWFLEVQLVEDLHAGPSGRTCHPSIRWWHRFIRARWAKSASSFLTAESFATLLVGCWHCILATTWPSPPAWHHSTAVQAACPYRAMLPVSRWRVGLTLKEAALLCPSSSYTSMDGG